MHTRCVGVIAGMGKGTGHWVGTPGGSHEQELWGFTDEIKYANEDMEDAKKGLAERNESEEMAACEKNHPETGVGRESSSV